MGNRGRQLAHRRQPGDAREFRLRLSQRFRGLHQFAGPFDDASFEFLIVALEFGFGSLERGGLKNVPIAVSPSEHKLVCTHHIQDLRSPARRKWVRAQHREALIPDNLIETIFIITKVRPFLL